MSRARGRGGSSVRTIHDLVRDAAEELGLTNLPVDPQEEQPLFPRRLNPDVPGAICPADEALISTKRVLVGRATSSPFALARPEARSAVERYSQRQQGAPVPLEASIWQFCADMHGKCVPLLMPELLAVAPRRKRGRGAAGALAADTSKLQRLQKAEEQGADGAVARAVVPEDDEEEEVVEEDEEEEEAEDYIHDYNESGDDGSDDDGGGAYM